jgi:hypothetical protein
MPPITAKTRAQVALRATTTVGTADSLDVVKQATSEVKGGGKSLLTSGLANVGATVHIEAELPDRLKLSITSGKRVVELCTFTAEATVVDGKTAVRVGGLETYKTFQSKLFYIIPTGPKRILGYDPYRRFLAAVEAGILAKDADANVTIAEPTA